jgi:hypothetical protein
MRRSDRGHEQHQARTAERSGASDCHEPVLSLLERRRRLLPKMTPAGRRSLAALTALTAVAVAPSGLQAARQRGAFGCTYTPRDRTVVLRLSPGGGTVTVRLGEGILLRPKVLRDVTLSGSAGLAPGTQNGTAAMPDHVYAAVATGHAAVAARTVSGRAVHGEIRVTC